jgi:hypothetical protein
MFYDKSDWLYIRPPGVPWRIIVSRQTSSRINTSEAFCAVAVVFLTVTAFAAQQNRTHIASSLGEAGEAAVNAGLKGVFTYSGIFVAGRTLDQVLAHELPGVPEKPVPIVNYAGKYVWASRSLILHSSNGSVFQIDKNNNLVQVYFAHIVSH